jgi:hypothetical protein
MSDVQPNGARPSDGLNGQRDGLNGQRDELSVLPNEIHDVQHDGQLFHFCGQIYGLFYGHFFLAYL